MAICQLALPPHTMTCTDCKQVWDPKPARGKDAPTTDSLEREAKQHFTTCPGRKT